MTVVIAHRGDPVGHWENTLEAFESARALGASMVELDCKLTRDNHVVALHDHSLARLWGVDKPVRGVDWDDVRAIRRNGYRIPDLAEVLDALDVPVMLDMPDVEVLEAAVRVTETARAVDRCVFAGNIPALVHLRQAHRSARIALTWDRPRLPPTELLASAVPEWFNPCWRHATPEVVEWAHAGGLRVSVWTVDRRSRMRKVLRSGVDAVVTNHTARLVRLLDRRPPR